MRRWTLPLLALLVLALAATLAWLWLRPDGRGAGLRWQPPAALPPTLDLPQPLPAADADLAHYIATLDRPLFVASRRPPPPPPSAVAAVDTPPDLRVLGLYGRHGDAADGGMIARVDGQVKRVKVGDAVGRWTLKALRPGQAVLALGDTEQVYPLRRAAPDEALPPSGDNARPDSAAVTRPAAANAQMQRQVEEARQNLRRVNAIRARSGLPLLPEP